VIVFDLKCGGGHVFEAWFGSSAAYEEQRAGGLVSCPMCGDGDVSKAVMAPNIGAKGNRAKDNGRAAVPAPLSEHPPEVVKAAMAALAAAQAKALEGSQWVGGNFANRARAMHVGDEEQAPIHGQATKAEAEALIEDGVAIAPLPLPVAPPEVLN
jgi:hypothetical protein